MKKFISMLLALTTCGTLTLGTLSACEAQNGKDGANGKSAYELWIDAGNTGTETDFLNWLKGAKGDPGEKLRISDVKTEMYVEPNSHKQYLKTTYFYEDGTTETTYSHMDTPSGEYAFLLEDVFAVSEEPPQLHMLLESYMGGGIAVEIEPSMISDGYVDFSTPDLYRIEVHYQGEYYDFNILVVDPEDDSITSIEALYSPNVVWLVDGEGSVVPYADFPMRVTYANGNTEMIFLSDEEVSVNTEEFVEAGALFTAEVSYGGETLELNVLPVEEVDSTLITRVWNIGSNVLSALNDETLLTTKDEQIIFDVQFEDDYYHYYEALTIEHFNVDFTQPNYYNTYIPPEKLYGYNLSTTYYIYIYDAETDVLDEITIHPIKAVENAETLPTITATLAYTAENQYGTPTYYKEETATLTPDMFTSLDDVDFTTAGDYVVEVTYNDETYPATITVFDPEISNVANANLDNIPPLFSIPQYSDLEQSFELFIEDTVFYVEYYELVNGKDYGYVLSKDVTFDLDAIDMSKTGLQLLPYTCAGFEGTLIVNVTPLMLGAKIVGKYQYSLDSELTIEIILFDNGIAYSEDLGIVNSYSNYVQEDEIIFLDSMGFGMYVPLTVSKEDENVLVNYLPDEEAVPDKSYRGEISGNDAALYIYGNVGVLYMVMPPIEEGGEEVLMPVSAIKVDIDQETNSFKLGLMGVFELTEPADGETVGSFVLTINEGFLPY